MRNFSPSPVAAHTGEEASWRAASGRHIDNLLSRRSDPSWQYCAHDPEVEPARIKAILFRGFVPPDKHLLSAASESGTRRCLSCTWAMRSNLSDQSSLGWRDHASEPINCRRLLSRFSCLFAKNPRFVSFVVYSRNFAARSWDLQLMKAAVLFDRGCSGFCSLPPLSLLATLATSSCRNCWRRTALFSSSKPLSGAAGARSCAV